MFIKELTNLQTKEENHQRKGFLTPTIEVKASSCVYEIFKNTDKKENYKNLLEWIKGANLKTLPYICEILERIESGYGRIGDSTYSQNNFIEENNIEEIEHELINKIKEISVENCIFDIEDIHIVCLLWDFIDKESLSFYIREMLEKDENIPKYLWKISSYWHSSNSTEGWRFNEKSFGDYISIEDAFVRISKLKNTKEFSSLDKRFKQMTIAFYLWKQRDNEARMHITKAEVDSIIPSWEYTE